MSQARIYFTQSMTDKNFISKLKNREADLRSFDAKHLVLKYYRQLSEHVEEVNVNGFSHVTQLKRSKFAIRYL